MRKVKDKFHETSSLQVVCLTNWQIGCSLNFLLYVDSVGHLKTHTDLRQ